MYVTQCNCELQLFVSTVSYSADTQLRPCMCNQSDEPEKERADWDLPHLQLMWTIRNRPPKVTQHISINPVGTITDIAMVTVFDEDEVGGVSAPLGIIMKIDGETPRLTAIGGSILVSYGHIKKSTTKALD